MPVGCVSNLGRSISTPFLFTGVLWCGGILPSGGSLRLGCSLREPVGRAEDHEPQSTTRAVPEGNTRAEGFHRRVEYPRRNGSVAGALVLSAPIYALRLRVSLRLPYYLRPSCDALRSPSIGKCPIHLPVKCGTVPIRTPKVDRFSSASLHTEGNTKNVPTLGQVKPTHRWSPVPRHHKQPYGRPFRRTVRTITVSVLWFAHGDP